MELFQVDKCTNLNLNLSSDNIMLQTNKHSNKFTPLVATSRKALPQIYRNQSMEQTEQLRSNTNKVPSAEGGNKGPFIILALIFLSSLTALVFVYWSFPELQPGDAEKIKLPKSIEDAKGLGRALSHYTDEFFTQVTLAFIVVYIFLQTFAIPGSIFLSILSGFLFPFPMALFLVCLCSSVGASFCYLLFYLVGKKLVHYYMPERVDKWCIQVSHHKDDILSYIIFLRITPFLPNWFINITSPVIGVPLLPFFLGTFIGVAPPSFGFISAGVELYVLTTTGDAFSLKSISIVVISAILSLMPVFFRKQLKAKLE